MTLPNLSFEPGVPLSPNFNLFNYAGILKEFYISVFANKALVAIVSISPRNDRKISDCPIFYLIPETTHILPATTI